MQSKLSKFISTGVGAALVAFCLPAAAQAHEYRHHHHHHHYYHSAYDRPLTVSKRHRHYFAPGYAARDPWHNGPAAIVTGPNDVAATAVGLPFRGANAIFPASGDIDHNPLILIGAPIHVIGQAVEFPFYAVGTVFGAPPVGVYY